MGDVIFQFFAFGAVLIPVILLVVLFIMIKKHHNQVTRMEQKIDYLIKITKRNEEN